MSQEESQKELTPKQKKKEQKKLEKKKIKVIRKEKKKLSEGKLKGKVVDMYHKAKEPTLNLYQKVAKQIKSSIRLEILWIVGISLILSSLVGMSVKSIAKNAGIGQQSYTNYEESRQNLQSELVSVIQSITNIEQIGVEFNIDTEMIRNTISTLGVTEGAEQLQGELENMYVIRDINNEYSQYDDYGSYNMYPEGIPIEKYKELYKELNGLLIEQNWTEQSVNEIIEKFLRDVVGLTEGNIKKSAVATIVSNMDSNEYRIEEGQTYIIDSKGNTLYDNSFIKSIDVVQAIQKSQQSNNRNDNTVTSIYPIIIDEEIHYLFNESILRGIEEYYSTSTPNVLGVGTGATAFIMLMFYFTKSKLRYIEYISYCLGEISKGDLSYKIEVVGQDELAKVALDIAYMEEQIKNQIDAQMQAEKTKNELITNVAHDLRTPLTSIIGYVGLIKDKKFESEEEYEKYLDIAYSKAEKLKVLIEDLFEYTKLNNQAVNIKKESMSVASLMNQLIEELMPIAEEKEVTIRTDIKAIDTTIRADIPKMTRVFENLVENAIKYTESGEVVEITVEEMSGEVFISIRNKCKEIPQEDIDRLFDRFYRSDASRNSNTGGSGLGLAIAKNIVKLHGGEIWAQMSGNIISFNVKIKK
ncbi:MAG: HAMP domain-containing sensor histidine kinase [Cellulosilyticaceae bacterium]